ncbi:MAG: hypothetical protein AB7F09_26630 [Parvibaculaceae bacterium]
MANSPTTSGLDVAEDAIEATISVGPAMNLTLPESIVLYTISDEQLELVCRGGKDSSLDWCLGLAGIGIGFTQNIINCVGALNENKIPSYWDIGLGIASIALLAIAATKFFEHWKSSTSVEVLKATIKQGKRFVLKGQG